MSKIQLISLRKEGEHQDNLWEKESSLLPENPAQMSELSNDEMQGIKGGSIMYYVWIKGKKVGK